MYYVIRGGYIFIEHKVCDVERIALSRGYSIREFAGMHPIYLSANLHELPNLFMRFDTARNYETNSRAQNRDSPQTRTDMHSKKRVAPKVIYKSLFIET
jgi:hypothetical protein